MFIGSLRASCRDSVEICGRRVRTQFPHLWFGRVGPEKDSIRSPDGAEGLQHSQAINCGALRCRLKVAHY